jgi:type IV pilus assembly protein PilP
MTMVGSLRQGGKTHALLLVDGKLRDVTVGNHLGQNYGVIKSISENEITLVETVQDATGEWVQRTSTLQLQEKAR